MQKAAPREAGPQEGAAAADNDEDVEYEIVEYELQEGEDPADYAGSDEYEVVVEDAEAQPAAPEPPPAAPPQEEPSGNSLALRATGSTAAPRPPLRAVDLGPGGAQTGGMRGQSGRRLRLPLGAQDAAAPEAGGADAGAPPARPGGLPRLSGGERPAISETKAGRGDTVDPLLAAVDRRVSGARTPPEAGERTGIFGMTWRKGLGQPPRPAAESAAEAGSPDEPQADWENPAWNRAGSTGKSHGAPQGGRQPADAPTAAAAVPPATEGSTAAEPDGGSAAEGGEPNGPAAFVLPPPPAAAGEKGAATASGTAPEPAAEPDAATSAGPASEAQSETGRPAATGSDRAPDTLSSALGGETGRPAGPAAMTTADGRLGGPQSGPRRKSRRSWRDRHGAFAKDTPPAAEEGWPDYAAADMAPRRSRRRPLLLAAIGVLLVAGAAVVLALLGNSTAPDGIDYVALDQQQRAQEGQPEGATATPGPAAAAPDSSAPAALPAATGDATRDSPRALADVPRTDDGARNGAEAAAAIAELRQASDGGSAQAAYELGLRLHDGIGVRRDPDAAAVQFQRAADLGYAPAQLALGVAYEQGQGVPRDLEQAAYWYAVAADQGNADAQFNFGTLYARGEGVDQDYYQAAKWYRRAADAGLADAQFNYANMLESGLGVQQDRQEAYRYYRMAADAGDPVAAERERALAAALGADVVARLTAEDTTLQDSGAGAAETAPETEAPGRMAASDTAAPADAMASVSGDTGQTGMPEAAAPAAAPTAEQEAEPMTPLSGRQEIAELQDLLNRLGFDAGPADGVIGSRTRTAISAFQQAAGMPADGVPRRALLTELRQLAQTSR
ncbi:peptidoglycan-binding protein [Marinibaculum pumilum]|uniref:Peptidoglycan-binding protein n=1 Tax=Marinibaculum pumilum TaxID=1766165 RepID=A0ABV7L951_9PROT